MSDAPRDLTGMTGGSVRIAEALLNEYVIGTFNGRELHDRADVVDVALAISRVHDFSKIWPQPIPVSERLPELDVNVLAFDESQGKWGTASFTEFYSRGEPNWACDDGLSYRDITHWLPLPPSPQ